jgi:hypothetical protein
MEKRGVLDDGGGRPAADPETNIQSAVRGWRGSLINLTSANRLLDLQPGRAATIEVSRPAADDILARLRTGGTFTFRSLQHWPAASRPGADAHGGPDGEDGDGGQDAAGAALPASAPYILDTGKDPDDLDAALRSLLRRSQQQFLDAGTPALYLTFGTLRWTDRDQVSYASPLLLVPVRLVATEPRQPPMLEPTDHDPAVNPALSLKLSRHAIVLPQPEDPAEITLGGLLKMIREQIAGKDGWQVSDSVVLSCFSFMKEAMYRDLVEHDSLVVAHLAVRALAARELPGTGAAPAEIAGNQAPVRAAPGDCPLILPADSAQRACVAAALAGRSFTLDGPPGTGKSQTIANTIGALLYAGKTVLMVSHKAAALDVVADRLTAAGLGGYLLEVHSHKATRNQVASSLGAALDTVPAAPTAMPSTGLETARRRREQFTAYDNAMNRVREPLGCSLHDVLAMIASLHAVPAAPPIGLAPAHLTAEVFGEVRRAARALAAAWRPAAAGRSFPWRGVTETGPLDERLYQAASALEALAGAVKANQTLADATGLTRPSGVAELARLLDHLMRWPDGMPDDWLTMESLDAVDAAVSQLAAVLTAISARESQALQSAGVPWQAIPQPGGLPAVDIRALAALTSDDTDVRRLGTRQITELAREFSATADMLDKWLGTLSGLASMLGLHPPATFSDANDLLTLARLAGESDRPERAWLSVPGHRAASNAAQALHEAHSRMVRAEAEASAYFTPDALRYDVGELAQRFDDYHGLGRLSADRRADRRTVAAFTREGVTGEVAQQHLGLAVAWRDAAEMLAAAERNHAALLGPHYAGRGTDFGRLGRALTHAAIAVRCARGQNLARAAEFICRDVARSRAAASITPQTIHDLSAWQAALASAPVIAPHQELLTGPITDAIGWLRACAAPLHAASEFTRVVSEVAQRPLTYGQARQLITLREAVESAHEELAARDAVFAELCGSEYAGAATDVTQLRERLEWARRLRTMMSGGPGPLTPAHLDAAESAVATDRLAKAADAWREALHGLLTAFGPQRRRELAAELDDYQAGDELLEAMFNDATGRDEWHAYQAARASLAAYGMETVVDFCIAQDVAATQVPQVIDRALLHEWAEYQVRTDPALTPLRAAGRDELTAKFQQLDTALAAAAAEDIISACNARRPRGDTAESAVIYLEAAKNISQMPVRELLAQARTVTQAIKPCFLMSPLAVSQHLPEGMHFDVVIFDEASQISPADAISGIYRGGTVIMAGDSQQLPPATFAGSSALDAGEEPPSQPHASWVSDSVLDLARRSGAFGDLALSWHYRSADEELIAFANSAFYQTHLIPLPTPGGEPGTGVALVPGDPAGDRADEAARVAQRVIHHYDTRPALSLGVVAFSEAQVSAIEAALGEARQQRPDLDRLFTTGRLRGFFVKTAESVQGDERDAVIVYIGDGAAKKGQLTMDFGLLGRQEGWHALNVAITRARFRTEVVTGIRPADIPESATSDGLRYLRRYLSYLTQRLAR